MKRCYCLSKSGTRLNINTFKRTLYPHRHPFEFLPKVVPSHSSFSTSPSVSKASKLPWFTRLILWIKEKIFKF